MYKRLSAVLFPVVLIALIGAGVWGYQEHQDKNAVLIKAENQYQRAFHDLSFHLDQLHSELGNTIAVNSTSQDYYRKGLANVWRISSQAQSEINQLPLTLLPLNQTESFLDNISKFSYQTAVRDLNAKPLTDDERQTLKALYDHSSELSSQLRDVQGKVIAQHLRWMDVETALATQHEQLDNTIIDGFQTVDKKVSQYSEVNWGPSMDSLFQKRSMSMLEGNMATPDEIKAKAATFLGLADPSTLQVTENGNAAPEYSSFSVTTSTHGSADTVQLDYSKKGGQLLWFMAPHTVSSKVLDMRGARDAAAEFLDNHGYPGMTVVGYDEYNNVASVTFAGKQGDIVIYPEKVTVKVALDNGDVTGLQATDYVYEHKTRQLKAPGLSRDQAVKRLNPQFKVTSERQALIRNELNQDVLCYEFDGSINNSLYKIFINADTGHEEKIERVGADPQSGKSS